MRYDNAPWNLSQPLTGWEFEKEWAKWTRTDDTWYVAEAIMKVESPYTQDYCTGEILGAFNYSSTSFDPTFYGSATNWWSISGFPNIAYVPFYALTASTQADIYQGYVEKYNDAITKENFLRDP